VSDAITIFCSKCGAGSQQPDSYCRSCGEWLPDPAASGRRRGRLRRLSPERKQRRLRVLELLSAVAAAIAGFITFAVLNGADLELLAIPVILCFAVVAWQTVAFFMGRSIQGRRGSRSTEDGEALPAAHVGAIPALNAADTRNMVPPPSVTEHTTTLLDSTPLKKGGRER
jgi:hypothetical protein